MGQTGVEFENAIRDVEGGVATTGRENSTGQAGEEYSAYAHQMRAQMAVCLQRVCTHRARTMGSAGPKGAGGRASAGRSLGWQRVRRSAA